MVEDNSDLFQQAGLHSSTVLAQRSVEQFGNETTVNKQFQLHYVSTVAVSLIIKMG